MAACFSGRIADIYKERCLTIQLSASAAASALLPHPESSRSGEEEEVGDPKAVAAAAATAASAAAAREIVDALTKPDAVILADGLLTPQTAQNLRKGLVLGLTSRLVVLPSEALGMLLMTLQSNP